jgi:hypothetical protein
VPNKPKTSVNVDAIKRDSKKIGEQISKSEPSMFGKELDPGTSRRESPLEQEMGSSKYRQMIHDHNDKNKHILDRLPFTFPKKSVVRSNRSNVVIECVECGFQKYGTEHTYGIICPECKTFRRVINPEAESRGEASPEQEERIGVFGTASDLLELREKRRLKG